MYTYKIHKIEYNFSQIFIPLTSEDIEHQSELGHFFIH